MTAVGVHLTRRGARAVSVDDSGKASPPVVIESADPPAAARDAVRQIIDAPAAPIGAAIDPSDEIDVAAVKRALAAAGYRDRVHVVGAGEAALTAETWVGAAQGARDAVCLWIDETVFAGILLDGRTWSGAHGLAGSAAWLALNPVERQDYRKLGGLAAEVSTTGVARRLAWRIQAGDLSDVLERAGGLDAITGSLVFEGARSGDGVSISVVRDTAKFIGMAVANLANTLDPEVVVISGAVAAHRDLLLDVVRQESARRLVPALAGQVRCEMSAFAADGVAIGAARLAALAGN